MEKQKRVVSFIGITMISASLILAGGCSFKDTADAEMTAKSTPMESMKGMESMAPTMEATIMPSMQPIIEPSMEPSTAPPTTATTESTLAPITEQTKAPVATVAPTAKPTKAPMLTEKATAEPTVKPPVAPTAKPTASPMATMDHSTMATPVPTKAPVAASKTYEMTIKTFAYSPNTMIIPVNSEITFTNKDDVKHTVTAKDGSFKSELLAQDKSYTYKFTKAGVYEIYCEPHTFMTATITVE